MKYIIAALALVATTAFGAQTNNGCQGNCPTEGGGGASTSSATVGNVVGGNSAATANGGTGVGVGVGLGGKATVGDITNKNTATGGDAKQDQAQGQQQGQAQSLRNRNTANGGNATSEGSSAGASVTNAFTIEGDKAAASSAAALVVSVASACGGSAGASGQGIGGGGALGFSYEFVDCKVMREAAFMIGLAGGLDDNGRSMLVNAALLHVCSNIARVEKTFAMVGLDCSAKARAAAAPTGTPRVNGRS